MSSSSKRNNEPSSNGRSTRLSEDEAYAQALQEEYRKDFLRRQAKKNQYNQARREREQQQAHQQQFQQQQHQPRDTAVSPSAPPEDLLSSLYIVPASSSMGSVTPAPPPHAPPAPPSYNFKRSQTLDDEEYARRLQAQLEQEEQERIYHTIGRSTNNTHRSSDVRSSTVSATSYVDDTTRTAQQLQDEEYARRLQKQVLQEENRRRRQQQQQQQQNNRHETFPPHTTTPLYGRSTSTFMDERTNSSISEDEDAARRIQQELIDAEYAHRISVLEQQEALAQQVQQQENAAAAAAAAASRRRTPRQNCIRRLVPLLVCATAIAIVPLLFVMGVFNPNDIPVLSDIFGNQNDWLNNDPWTGNVTGLDGPTPGSDAYAWSNSGNGLALDILNACSDEWQVFINEGVTNWDNGYPIDSLTLRTTRIEYESACSQVRGKLKICNGNYGDKRWRGLNEVMLSRQNVIMSSVAYLNEYYLSRESDAQRLYTVCHELGHGFGLPHWDEDFFNKDLGNCMDYTVNPERNSKPDESNFLYLAQLYGGRNVTTSESTTISGDSPSATEESVPPPSNRNRRRTQLRQHHQQSATSSRLLDVLPYNPHRRILHASQDREVHMIPTNDGHGAMIVQHYLLA
ncbi:hypothetical protein IV203_033375 [Nitzschia inconspicua]|uniref:Peptidase M10 metallopeptidase domain-containing protein n=1 Tax=Nitzschia inconspicua TaxID=303405 RepID=A0A9K3KLC9_9STRA|nr:hypothetical protein IV203_033375 [Nitzschia inconspicua]